MPFLGGLQQRLLGGLEALVSNGSEISLLPDPSTIPNLVLWLRGDGISGTNGQPITSWLDKSSQAAVYTNKNTGSNQSTLTTSDPLFNNLPTLTNPTVNCTLTTTTNNGSINQPFTIYTAFYTTDLTQSDQIAVSDAGDTTELGLLGAFPYQYGPSPVEYTASGIANNTPMLLCGVYNGDLSAMYWNNANVALPLHSGTFPTSNISGKFVVGFVNDADAVLGNIAEICVYQGAHTAAQRDTIYAYMAQRYNKPSWVEPAFTPGDLNPLAWFSSDSGVSLVSGKVSQWLDQSGNNVTLTQSSAGSRPTFNTGGSGGKPRITFDGTASYMSNSSFTRATTSPVEVFIVMNTSSSTTDGNILDLGQFNNDLLLSSLTTYMYNGSEIVGPTITTGKTFILNGAQDGSGNGSITINAGTPTTGSVGTNPQYQTWLTLGALDNGLEFFYPGDIYEVIVLPAILDGGQRANLYDYLNAKYALMTPLSLSPTAWYRADLGATTAGGFITALADQSGNGYDLTVNTAGGALAPGYSASAGPNGTAALVYTELTTMGLSNASFPVSSVMDIFIVATSSTASAASNDYLIGSYAATFEIFQIEGDDVINSSQDGGLHNLMATPRVNVPFILESSTVGTTSSAITMINGANTGMTGNAGSNSPSSGIELGHYGGSPTGTFSWNGQINECIIFNYTLSSSQRSQLIAYFNQRYNIPS